MIIRDEKDHFILVRQHDHAYISGVLASKWKEDLFAKQERREDVIYAIYEHDRAWIPADDVPFWNDAKQAPYSFMDFPQLAKLSFYKMGLDEVTQKNPYAGLLCSMHYTSFFKSNEQQAAQEFVEQEENRQQHIREKQNIKADDVALESHFALLQLCDDMSLYVCLNKPGASKQEETAWYRDGFKNAERIQPLGEKIRVHWLNKNSIAMQPFPFSSEFSIKLKYKSISKKLIKENGVTKAFEDTDWSELLVAFKKG